jgi:SHS2 domain-containing protein
LPYRFVEHTADIAFEAWAGDLPSLFVAAAAALLKSMVDNPEAVLPVHHFEVDVESPELDLLLLAVLQEPVWFKDARGLLLTASDVRVEGAADGFRACVTLTGEEMDPGRHDLRADVKAVTAHQLKVEETSSGWRCRVVLDV